MPDRVLTPIRNGHARAAALIRASQTAVISQATIIVRIAISPVLDTTVMPILTTFAVGIRVIVIGFEQRKAEKDSISFSVMTVASPVVTTVATPAAVTASPASRAPSPASRAPSPASRAPASLCDLGHGARGIVRHVTKWHGRLSGTRRRGRRRPACRQRKSKTDCCKKTANNSRNSKHLCEPPCDCLRGCLRAAPMDMCPAPIVRFNRPRFRPRFDCKQVMILQ